MVFSTTYLLYNTVPCAAPNTSATAITCTSTMAETLHPQRGLDPLMYKVMVQCSFGLASFEANGMTYIPRGGSTCRPREIRIDGCVCVCVCE